MGTDTILLIEDNPDDEMLTLRALKKSGIDACTTVVRDGAEALDYLMARGDYADRSPTDLPQLILLDLKLPRIDGLNVIRKLRENPTTQTLPIVVLTTSDERSDIVESYRLGANSYIRKPVDFVAFSEAIVQLGQYWLSLNEPPPVGE